MIGLAPQRHPLRILCLGAHPDDIEIGCGGTLLEIAADPSTEVSAVVMTGSPARREEAERSLPQLCPGNSGTRFWISRTGGSLRTGML